jgi:hypothetical protein
MPFDQPAERRHLQATTKCALTVAVSVFIIQCGNEDTQDLVSEQISPVPSTAE